MILVTGSDGIIGRTLCRTFSQLSIEFLPVTHRRKPHTLPGALRVDLANDCRLIARYTKRLSAIVHLAAAVPHSAEYPDTEATAELTRKIDKNLHQLQRETDVPLVYMSTCGLYDRVCTKLKYEHDSSQIKVVSPYFSAKLEGESLFLSDGTSIVLRLAAPIGVGIYPNLVLSRFIYAAKTHGAIRLWGNGSREQDFIDSRDVAELIVKVLNRPEKTVLNVASGSPTTMSQLASAVIAAVGSGFVEMTAQSDPREGETARYSIARAKQLYGWIPQRTLDESLLNVVNKTSKEIGK